MKGVAKRKVVVIGGGTGLSVLLRGLKKLPFDITAIVTVADDGGSSGRIRDEFSIPPPGDIRNVIAALSDVEPLIEEMFQHRFDTGNGLSGHSLGNLIITALTSITGDFTTAIQEMGKVLNVHGKVLPAANQSVVLHAEMEDGTIVTGESKIPLVNKKINRVFLTPENVSPLRETIHSIKAADLIIIGPGSLYTSILPNLLVPGIGEAVCQAKAKKVYICNLMTQFGETVGFTASDHVRVLYDHMCTPFIDTILVNHESVPEEIKKIYEAELAKPVEYDLGRLEELGLNILHDEIITFDDHLIRHKADKVAQILYSLIHEEG